MTRIDGAKIMQFISNNSDIKMRNKVDMNINKWKVRLENLYENKRIPQTMKFKKNDFLDADKLILSSKIPIKKIKDAIKKMDGFKVFSDEIQN